jgi:hypothetical protein
MFDKLELLETLKDPENLENPENQETLELYIPRTTSDKGSVAYKDDGGLD